jgi:xylan 1,4-beta-xylosidase
MYSSYTAASFSRKLEIARKRGVNLEGALTWAFEFEDQPPFAGFRQLASAGIDLPVLNVFRMFGKMSGQMLRVTSSAGMSAEAIRDHNVRETPDVSANACLDGRQISVLVWHYHDDDVPGPDASVTLALNDLPVSNGKAMVTHYRIDADHSNSYEAWKKMGSPQKPTAEQFADLEKAGQLATLGESKTVEIKEGTAELNFKLPRQGVSFLQLTLQ